MSEEVQKHSVHTLVFRSLKRSHDLFLSNQSLSVPVDDKTLKIKRAIKARDSYGLVFDKVQKAQANKEAQTSQALSIRRANSPPPPGVTEEELDEEAAASGVGGTNNALVQFTRPNTTPYNSGGRQDSLLPLINKKPILPKPKWHAPWKLCRVISGHLGWVRCVAVEPGNEWFATGAADRVIKVFDLASGKLKLSLTGHVSTVRGLAVSPRHPYLFSCGEDRQVKCWDLEYNKVIRHYHGHLSAVYSLALHPAIDVLVTAGRDSTARIWDMRTKANIHTLTGHTNTIASVICQTADPQIITGSHDSTIRLWDLAAGKSMCTLTNHKKSVRSLVFHPTLYMFASASPDNIKQWRCPEGKFIQNLGGHNSIVNCMAMNPEGVLVSGGDNGTMYFWDWRTGYNFQRLQSAVQPGSMDSEAGIFSMTFDQSGSRLITTEADKTIKIYKEDDTADESSHPVNWKPEILKRRKF